MSRVAVGETGAGLAEPTVTDLRQADHLLYLCSTLGIRDQDENSPAVYHKGEECREVIQDITRMLRREDSHSKHSVLRQLGAFRIFQQDLVPLLIQYADSPEKTQNKRDAKEDERLNFALLKLMVHMSMPAMMTFDGLEEKIEQSKEFTQQVDFLRSYKVSMVQAYNMVSTKADLQMGRGPTYTRPVALDALIKILYAPLTAERRSSKHEDIIELVLLIIRNLSHCPNFNMTNPSKETLQDRCILAFDQTGILELVVSLANDMEQNDVFAGLLMEIVVYLLRGQSPVGICDTTEVVNADARNRERALRAYQIKMQREKESKNAAMAKKYRNSRHSRFGGSFEIKRLPTDAKPKFYGNSLVGLKKNKGSVFTDQGKTSRVNAKKIFNPDLDCPEIHISPLRVRQILKKFCSQFLCDAYNVIMPAIYSSIKANEGRGDKLMQYDEVHYCQMIRFFMEFHRLQRDEKQNKEEIDVSMVASTLRREDVKYVKDLVMKYAIQCREDASGAVLWSQRLHHALRAFHEILVNLDELHRSPNVDQRDFAVSTLADLFYEYEFLEMLPRIVKAYKPAKQTDGFIRDLILTIHLILRMVRALQKSDAFKLFMQKKRRKKRTAKAKEGQEGQTKKPAEESTTTTSTSDLAATLFENDNVGEEAPREEYTEGNEFEFDFEAYQDKFADAKVVRCYIEVLRNYKENGPHVNHAVIKMFYRIFANEHCDRRWLLYQLTLFSLFDKILNDEEISNMSEFKEMKNFITKGVMRQFFDDAKQYPPLFVEILFLKDSHDLNEIELGPSRAKLLRKKKAAKWSTESEQKLIELHAKYVDDDDALELITEGIQKHFEELADASEAMVRHRLKKLDLAVLPPSRWTENELEELRDLYEEQIEKGSKTPLQNIVDKNIFKKSKNTAGKLKNQLKKMGLDVSLAGATTKSTPWIPEDLVVLKELHDEFKDLFNQATELIATISLDPRLGTKTKASIKVKMQELGMIRSVKRKQQASDTETSASEEDANDENSFDGGLDRDFARNLRALVLKLKKSEEGKHSISWLMTQMKKAESEENSRIILAPEESVKESIRPLVGILGFIEATDSDTEDSDDEKSSTQKTATWAIPAHLSKERLQGMLVVLGSEPRQKTRKKNRKKKSKSRRQQNSDDDNDGTQVDLAESRARREKMLELIKSKQRRARRREAHDAGSSSNEEENDKVNGSPGATENIASNKDTTESVTDATQEDPATENTITTKIDKANRNRKRRLVGIFSDSDSSDEGKDSMDELPDVDLGQPKSAPQSKRKGMIDSDVDEDEDKPTTNEQTPASSKRKGLVDSDDDEDSPVTKAINPAPDDEDDDLAKKITLAHPTKRRALLDSDEEEEDNFAVKEITPGHNPGSGQNLGQVLTFESTENSDLGK
eukprot:m.99017 g.99017  ORF g.99017 m.99017 type:complete len:1397 (+) comp13660_c0_seq1:142-4332(+)